MNLEFYPTHELTNRQYPNSMLLHPHARLATKARKKKEEEAYVGSGERVLEREVREWGWHGGRQCCLTLDSYDETKQGNMNPYYRNIGFDGRNLVWLAKQIIVQWNLSKRRMLHGQRRELRITIPFYENKGGAQSCTNYQAIKLKRNMMRLWSE